MTDENLARLRAHRNNIQRYRRLLATQLFEVERAYILKRLAEEETAAETLDTLPFNLLSTRRPERATAQVAS